MLQRIVQLVNYKSKSRWRKNDPTIYKSCYFRPARSKHCSMCKACIGRLDHHCAWINGCVGENNQRYFFIFLMTLVQFCAYGAYLCFQIYRGMIIEWGLDKAFVYDPLTHLKTPVSFYKAFLVSKIIVLKATHNIYIYI